MARILEANEVGFGILLERDAGWVQTLDEQKKLNENFEIKPAQPLLINCILQKWGVENKNGRIYPKDVLRPQVDEYQKLVQDNEAASEADHPDTSIISLHNISHLITKMWWGTGEQEHILFGQFKLIVTRGYIEMGIVSVIGDKILLYLENGIKLGISSRGVGSLEEINGKKIVQNDFELVGFDLVKSPSTPGAHLFPSEQSMGNTPIKENYIKKNGIYLKENSNKIISAVDNFLIN